MTSTRRCWNAFCVQLARTSDLDTLRSARCSSGEMELSPLLPATRETLMHASAVVIAPPSRVSRGVFGARMLVELVNDGPVTIVLDT